jgi:hypothetical protein
MAPLQMPKTNQPIFPQGATSSPSPSQSPPYIVLSINRLPIIMCDSTIEDPTMGNPKKMKLYKEAIFVF